MMMFHMMFLPFSGCLDDSTVKLSPRRDGPFLLQTQVCFTLAGYSGFFGNVFSGLGLMGVDENGGQIRFPMAPTVNNRYNMIALPRLTRPDLTSRYVANAMATIKNT
jgi:hypothetical protein